MRLSDYRMGSQHIRFWLEWNRGTMNVRNLAIKFSSYRHYIASRQWASESLSLPTLCCIAPDIVQERRLQRVAQSGLSQTPGLVLRTITEVLLREQGLLTAIWLQGMPRHRQASQPERSHRQYLFDVLLG